MNPNPSLSFGPTALKPAIDLERLKDACDGTPDGMLELLQFYAEQMAADLNQLRAAVIHGPRHQVGRLAHRCVGASSVCGLVAILDPLREIERMGDEAAAEGMGALIDDVEAEFDRIRSAVRSGRIMELAEINQPKELL